MGNKKLLDDEEIKKLFRVVAKGVKKKYAAQRFGISEGSLYYYEKTRDDLQPIEGE